MNRYQKTREGIRNVARADAEAGTYNNTYRRDDYRLSYRFAYERWQALSPAQRTAERAYKAVQAAPEARYEVEVDHLGGVTLATQLTAPHARWACQTAVERGQAIRVRQLAADEPTRPGVWEVQS
jgi:hypothetical protein